MALKCRLRKQFFSVDVSDDWSGGPTDLPATPSGPKNRSRPDWSSEVHAPTPRPPQRPQTSQRSARLGGGREGQSLRFRFRKTSRLVPKPWVSATSKTRNLVQRRLFFLHARGTGRDLYDFLKHIDLAFISNDGTYLCVLQEWKRWCWLPSKGRPSTWPPKWLRRNLMTIRQTCGQLGP